MPDPAKPRLLTGDRPTGPLHLGHLVGSLDARVALQDTHECFVLVADLHSLTTRAMREDIAELPGRVRQIVLDQLAAGLDPARSTIYLQSGVPAVYDLAILLQMLVPRARLERVETVHAMARDVGLAETEITMGLLGYPVLQAADILMARATVIPVGRDNEEHVAIARECAESFNLRYGEVFPLPSARISRSPALPGVAAGAGSGHKMSKSLGNAVYLADGPDAVASKLRTLGFDAGEPRPALIEIVRAFLSDEQAEALARELADGRTSLAAAHELAIAAVERRLAPIRARRAELAAQTGLVEEILVDGTIRAREVAYQTLLRVREAMGLEALWLGLVQATEARAKERKKPY
jgi:tryptophanyl-tRNA synthetase